MGQSASNGKTSHHHVVIIGAGYGGISVATKLQGDFKVTLIDPKESFHHCVAALRACTEKGIARQSFIPYEPTFGQSFKRGFVEAIDWNAKKVTLKGGEEVGYDFLVIATGSRGSFPAKVSGGEDTSVYISQYFEIFQKIQCSQDIVVIGGGAVGVEMAGELATDYKDKEVTLVHSKDYLVQGNFNSKFRKGAMDQLQAKGVRLVLGERVSNLDELPRDGSSRCTVRTDKGTTIGADLVICCLGLPCDSSAYASSLSSSMEKTGHLKVNEFFQVTGVEDVFAIGDCCNIDPVKLAFLAGMHGEIVAMNIKMIVQGKTKLKAWKNPGPMILLPVGRDGGMFQVGSFVFGSFFTRKLKSEGLFISKQWATMKQQVPQRKDSEF